jgi:WD40 repeat protein
LEIQRIDTFSGHKAPIYSLEEGREPHFIYSAGSDGWVVEWNLQKPDLGKVLAHIEGSVYCLKLDRSTNIFWVGQNFEGIHGVQVNDQSQVFSISMPNKSIFDICFWDNQVWVAHDHGLISVIDRESQQIIKHIKSGDKSARRFCLIGQDRIAIGFSDGFIRVFNNNFELEFAWLAHDLSVFSMIYEDSSHSLLSVGRDAKIKRWLLDGENTRLVQEVPAHIYAIHDVVVSPDQQLFASASMDKTIKIWRANDLTLLKVIDAPRYGSHKNSVNKLLWSSYQDFLVSASDDKNISIWKIL